MLAVRISAALSAEWLIPSRCRSAAALAELSQQQVWQRLTSVREKKKKANAVVEPSLANRDTKDTIGFASPVKSLARTIPLSQKRRTVWAEEHMSSISFNVFAKQAIYWAEHAGNVTGASPRLPLALCVGDAASKFPPNGCLARPQRTRRTQVKCFSSGWR